MPFRGEWGFIRNSTYEHIAKTSRTQVRGTLDVPAWKREGRRSAVLERALRRGAGYGGHHLSRPVRSASPNEGNVKVQMGVGG